MRVAIAGAGSVGRSIASELIENGHDVMLIDRDPGDQAASDEAAEWVQADACELAITGGGQAAGPATSSSPHRRRQGQSGRLAAGQDRFAVGRVVGRVNDPRNEWLFTEAWGVDVAVSTPRMLAALVEEAVSVGDLVRLFTLRQGQANLVEVTLPSTAVGRPAGARPAPAAGRGDGDHPARRAGHRAVAGRAGRGRRRVAVRCAPRCRGRGPRRTQLIPRCSAASPSGRSHVEAGATTQAATGRFGQAGSRSAITTVMLSGAPASSASLIS